MNELNAALEEGEQAQAAEAALTTPNDANAGESPDEVMAQGEIPQTTDQSEFSVSQSQAGSAVNPADLSRAKAQYGAAAQTAQGVEQGRMGYAQARAEEEAAQGVLAQKNQAVEEERRQGMQDLMAERVQEDGNFKAQQEKVQAHWDKVNGMIDTMDTLAKRIQEGNYGPKSRDEWFQQHPGTAAVTIIGSVLGGLGAALTHTGGNAFLDGIERRINQDLHMQAMALEKDKSAFEQSRYVVADFMKLGLDKQHAIQAAHVATLEAIQNRVQQLGSRITDATKQQVIAQAAADLAKRKTLLAQDLMTKVLNPLMKDQEALTRLGVSVANATRQSTSAYNAVENRQLRQAKSQGEFELRATRMFEQGGDEGVKQARRRMINVQNALAFDKLYPNPDDMPEKQYSELVAELGQIATGSAGSEGLRNRLEAQTAVSAAKKFMAYWSGQPTKAALGGFIKDHMKYLKELKNDYQSSIKEFHKRTYNSIKDNPMASDRFKQNIRKSFQIDEGE